MRIERGAMPSTSRGMITNRGYSARGYVYEHKSVPDTAFREHELRTFVSGKGADPAKVPDNGLENIFNSSLQEMISGQIVLVAVDHSRDTPPIVSENYSRFHVLEIAIKR